MQAVGLSPEGQKLWLKQIVDDERVVTCPVNGRDGATRAAELKVTAPVLVVAQILVLHHNERDGATYPGITRIAAKARLSERAVKTALKTLQSLGHLTIRRRGATSSQYDLCLRGARGAHRDMDVVHETGTDVQEVHSRSAPPAPKPESKPESTKPDSGSVPVAGTREETRHASLPTPDVVRLARDVQQKAGKPGWGRDKALAAVVAAVERVGLAAVQSWAANYAPDTAPWQLQRDLAALGQAPAATLVAAVAAPPRAPAAPLSPLEAAALHEMEISSPGTKLRWHSRARRLGATAAGADLRGWIASVAREFLGEECPRMLARIESEAAAV